MRATWPRAGQPPAAAALSQRCATRPAPPAQPARRRRGARPARGAGMALRVAAVHAAPQPRAEADAPRTETDLQAFLEREGVRATLRATSRATPTVTASALALGVPPDRVLKSLVFCVGDACVLVVAPGEGRVDARKLAAALGVRRSALRLAPPDTAAAATGFAVGTIPPLGHAAPLRTLLDAAVLAGGPERVVYAGGGGTATQLVVSAGELLRATGAQVADLLQGRAADAADALAAAAAASFPEESLLLGAFGPRQQPRQQLLGDNGGGEEPLLLDQRMTPTRPLRADVAAVLAAPPSAELVALEATVLRVRRMGRLLLFASLTQPHWEGAPDAALQLPLADAGGATTPVALQAIAGRTLARALGDDAAAALLQSVRPGMRVRIAGRLQPNPRAGCVDVVVAELTCLELAASAPAQLSSTDAVEADSSTAEPRDPDAWLFADDVAAENLAEDDATFDDALDGDELVQYTNACGDAAEEAGLTPAAAKWAAPATRRRSSPRRGGFAAPLTPLTPFAPPPGFATALVATADDVAAMAAELLNPDSPTHAPLPDAASSDTSDAPAALPPAVGLDAEWRPYGRGAAATPVALLQLSTRRAAYLVDMLALAVAPDGLAALDGALGALLRSERVVKLGFGLQHDLQRLCESYPSLRLASLDATSSAAAPAARALLELRAAALVAAPEALPWLPHPRRLAGAGLASLARLVLRAELDKRPQTSDWAARPLAAAQVAYAAADAHVLTAVLDALLARSPRLRSRLPVLLAAPPGRAALGLPPQALAQARAQSRRGERAPPARGDKVALAELRVSVPLLLDQFLGAPLPGKGRDAALAAAAAAGEGGERPRGAGGCRGGVLECANATLLFMNAEPTAGKRYPNQFWRRASDAALMVSWFGGPGQHEDTPQVARLMRGAAANDCDAVLLFARLPRGPYVFCGRLTCDGTGDEGDDGENATAPARGLLRLRMRLIDAPPLCGSAHFAALLAHAQGDAGLALLGRR